MQKHFFQCFQLIDETKRLWEFLELTDFIRLLNIFTHDLTARCLSSLVVIGLSWGRWALKIPPTPRWLHRPTAEHADDAGIRGWKPSAAPSAYLQGAIREICVCVCVTANTWLHLNAAAFYISNALVLDVFICSWPSSSSLFEVVFWGSRSPKSVYSLWMMEEDDATDTWWSWAPSKVPQSQFRTASGVPGLFLCNS